MTVDADATTTRTGQDYERYWDRGFTWREYLEEEVEEHEALWRGVYRKHQTPAWARERAASLPAGWKLLVITEDWCGDASNSVPVVARLAEAAPNLDLRLVKRDENPELMDRHLTNGGRAIPVVILLDEDFRPADSWGPRPEELQRFVLAEKEKGKRPTAEIYREARRWYARDGGETLLRELLDTLEEAGRGKSAG